MLAGGCSEPLDPDTVQERFDAGKNRVPIPASTLRRGCLSGWKFARCNIDRAHHGAANQIAVGYGDAGAGRRASRKVRCLLRSSHSNVRLCIKVKDRSWPRAMAYSAHGLSASQS